MAWNRMWIDISMLCYAASMALLFVDVVQPRRMVNRTALLLLFAVFVAETIFLFERLQHLGIVSVYTRSDVLLLLSWLLLVAAMVVNTFFRIDLVLFFANILGFATVAFTTFTGSSRNLYANHVGDLLLLHVGFALLSYVAFSFAFVFSLMYVVQDYLLREKRWNRWYFRLPSLERLDTYTFRSIVAGFPLLLVAMVLGFVWGQVSLHRWLFMDPKLLATAALWLMYGTYLIMRLRSGWAGSKLIWYNMLCFTGVLVNFVVIGNFSLFHSTW